MAEGQQHFTIGVEMKAAFTRFCEDQGLSPKLVFLAGWRALDKAEKEPRKRWFEGLSPWQSEIMAKWGPDGRASKTEGTDAAKPKRKKTA